jgi:Rrf2 family nitric oxide-sensitive transcriptional repressor
MFCAECESRQNVATIQEIADLHGISKSHLTKIVMTLATHGYLQTSRGRGGGLRLGRSAALINLGAVVRLTETDFEIVACFKDDPRSCALMPACHLKKVLADALEAFFVQLDGTTLADLINKTQANRNALLPLDFKLPLPCSRSRQMP